MPDAAPSPALVDVLRVPSAGAPFDGFGVPLRPFAAPVLLLLPAAVRDVAAAVDADVRPVAADATGALAGLRAFAAPRVAAWAAPDAVAGEAGKRPATSDRPAGLLAAGFAARGPADPRLAFPAADLVATACFALGFFATAFFATAFFATAFFATAFFATGFFSTGFFATAFFATAAFATAFFAMGFFAAACFATAFFAAPFFATGFFAAACVATTFLVPLVPPVVLRAALPRAWVRRGLVVAMRISLSHRNGGAADRRPILDNTAGMQAR